MKHKSKIVVQFLNRHNYNYLTIEVIKILSKLLNNQFESTRITEVTPFTSLIFSISSVK
jgi:hypothetical protein